MFYEAMEEILPELKVVIESPSGNVEMIYPVESFTSSAQGSTGSQTQSNIIG